MYHKTLITYSISSDLFSMPTVKERKEKRAINWKRIPDKPEKAVA